MDLFDARVHDHLHAHQARLVGGVDGGARDPHAVVGGLDEGVLFGMKGALAALAAVHYPDQAPHLIAMGHPRGAPIVTRREDALVAHYDGADGEPRAGRAGSDLVRYTHEILVPRGTDLLQLLVGIRSVYGWVSKGFHTVYLRRRRGLGR